MRAYIAPETEGNQLQEFIVLYDGAYYKLPAPVSSFTANGWQINKEESDAAVKNGKVTAKKNAKGKKVKITAAATDGSGKKKTITIRIR